jgi:hypothetical protein
MESQKVSIARIVGHLRTNYLFVIALSAVLLHLARYYVLGQNVFIGPHDLFESTAVWQKLLVESGLIFSGSEEVIPAIMDGLPRISFGSEFFAPLWFVAAFGLFNAYVINQTAMHLVGFVGMYFLLRTHFLLKEKYKILNLGVAVCFAILPFYPSAGLSVAGLPLALYSFLNIRAGNMTKKDLAILVLIPLYSSLAYTYLFFIIIMGMLWFYDLIRTHEIGKPFFAALLLMTIEFILIEYRLVVAMFVGEGFVSHRTEMRIQSFSFLESLVRSLQNFIVGHYHVSTFHGLVILFAVFFAILLIMSSRMELLRKPITILGFGGLLGIVAGVFVLGYNSLIGKVFAALNLALLGPFYPFSLIGTVGLVCLLALILWFWFKRSENFRVAIRENLDRLWMLFGLLFLSFVISLWFGFWQSVYLVPLKQQFTILQAFNFSRFHWLHPLFYYILFAVALSAIYDGIEFEFKRLKLGQVLVIGLLLLQFSILLPNSWATISVQYGGHDYITYRQFFAEDLFAQIDDDIGLSKETYRVINIGLHPAIAQYNGFYTLDGYSNNYPLEYKHRFRNIIGYELAKDDELRSYYDDWGSRCYVLVHELDRNFYCTKDDNIVINNLQLNTTALYEMDCSYIFSAVNITNYVANSLQLNGVYEHPDSAWRIFLYEVV